MSSNLQNPIFLDNDKAREWLEARVWPNGVTCRHCGNADASRIAHLNGKAHRPGVYQCAECRQQFTVTVGTVFERSKIPLSKWLSALFLLASSKKGMSAHQIHRMIGVSYKSTWFMCHRLREAMRTGNLAPMGGAGSIVEIDETYIGKKEGAIKARGTGHKNSVLTLIERGGSARSFHIERTTKDEIIPIVKANIAKESHVMTDESAVYAKLGEYFASHDSVDHSREEYAYRDRATNLIVSVNMTEGFYSVFKRGMKGVYQHCKEKHLHRYVAEFDFRYSHRSARGIEDVERAEILASGIVGKRLTYRRPHHAQT